MWFLTAHACIQVSWDRPLSTTPKRIVVLGGGFAGVTAASRLEKIWHDDQAVDVTIISSDNYLLFTPMLPEVPASSIEAKHIISPLRAFFRKVRFQVNEVQSVDFDRRIVDVSHCPNCPADEIPYDYLILALGSTTNFFGLPGVAEHSFSMRTLSDAMILRNHVISLFEHADLQKDSQTRRRMLTFVVAGGGFAGVETIAELRDFARMARRYYPNIRPEEVRFVLVDRGSRIMSEISSDLGDYARKLLEKRGVEFHLETGVKAAAEDWIELDNDQTIPTQTLIWTAGTSPNPLLRSFPCKRNKRGQVVVNEYLEVPGIDNVWALGDCAEIPDPFYSRRPHPPTAQHAIREGKAVAANVSGAIRGGEKSPFRYKPLGVLASIGRRSAVAEILGFKFSGFFAWWLWRTLYLLKLPGFDRKVRVAIDWTLDLFFPRDIVLIKHLTRAALGESARTERGAAPSPEMETDA